MPKKEFALTGQLGSIQHLKLEWKRNYKNFTIYLDDQQIGLIENRKMLKQSSSFTLPDKSVLSINLEGARLHVLHDGKPVTGSDSDPLQIWKNAYQLIMFLGGLWLVLGTLAELFEVNLLLNLGVGIFSALTGLILLGLGYMAMKRSLTALYLAIGLYGLDGVLGFIAIISQEGRTPGVGGFVVRALFLWYMIQGIPALQQIKREGL